METKNRFLSVLAVCFLISHTILGFICTLIFSLVSVWYDPMSIHDFPLEEVSAPLPEVNSLWYQNKWVWMGLAGIATIILIYWLVRSLSPMTPEDMANLQETLKKHISDLQEEQSNLNESLNSQVDAALEATCEIAQTLQETQMITEQTLVIAASVAAASGQLTRTVLRNYEQVEAISDSYDQVTLPGLEYLINEPHALFRPQPMLETQLTSEAIQYILTYVYLESAAVAVFQQLLLEIQPNSN